MRPTDGRWSVALTAAAAVDAVVVVVINGVELLKRGERQIWQRRSLARHGVDVGGGGRCGGGHGVKRRQLRRSSPPAGERLQTQRASFIAEEEAGFGHFAHAHVGHHPRRCAHLVVIVTVDRHAVVHRVPMQSKYTYIHLEKYL